MNAPGFHTLNLTAQLVDQIVEQMMEQAFEASQRGTAVQVPEFIVINGQPFLLTEWLGVTAGKQ